MNLPLWGRMWGQTAGQYHRRRCTENFSAINLMSLILSFLSLHVNFPKQSQILSYLDLKSFNGSHSIQQSSKSRALHGLTFVHLCAILCPTTSHMLLPPAIWNVLCFRWWLIEASGPSYIPFSQLRSHAISLHSGADSDDPPLASCSTLSRYLS